jgi:GntR family transcriptional regulator
LERQIVTVPGDEVVFPSGGKLRADHRPLYVRAEEALRVLLTSGAYQPGVQLPTEPELAQHLGISRSTLREAMRTFEERGWITRRQGVGTFVSHFSPATPLIDSGLEVLESIDQLAHRIGLKSEMGEAVIEERLATAAELAGLGLNAGAYLLSVARSVLVDSHPIAYLQDALPLEFLRKVELGEGFTGSVLDLLLKRGYPPLAYSHTRLAAAAAGAALARRLRIARCAPLLKLEAQLYSQENRVVDYSISYFVPGYFNFHVVRRIARYSEPR